VPNRHRYHLTDKGRQLTTALNAMLCSSTEQLLDESSLDDGDVDCDRDTEPDSESLNFRHSWNPRLKGAHSAPSLHRNRAADSMRITANG